MKISSLAGAAILGVIALSAQGIAVMAAEVKVMAGAGMRGAFGELIPQFERRTGHKIIIQYGGGPALKKQIETGEAFDIAIIDAAEVDDLIKQGKIAGDTRADIVRIGLGVAVRAGAPKPDVSSVDAFKNTLLSVKSFTYAQVGSAATHLPKVFDRLGIAEQVKSKIQLNALDRVPQVVAAGEVELAIAGVSFLLAAKGVQLVSPLPADLQSWIVNTAGISVTAMQPDAAKALIKYLGTPEAAAVIKAKGMEPLGQ